MILVLDTSVLIDIENKHARTLGKLAELHEQYPLPLRITFMSYFEFYHGLKIKTPSNVAASLAFLELFEVVVPTKETARLLSQLKHKYEQSLSDLLIAAQVMEHDGILVTSDKSFDQIQELRKIILE